MKPNTFRIFSVIVILPVLFESSLVCAGIIDERRELEKKNEIYVVEIRKIEKLFNEDSAEQLRIENDYQNYCFGKINQSWEIRNKTLIIENDRLQTRRDKYETLNARNQTIDDGLEAARKNIEKKYANTDKLNNTAYIREFRNLYINPFELLLVEKKKVLQGYKEVSGRIRGFQSRYRRFINKCKSSG